MDQVQMHLFVAIRERSPLDLRGHHKAVSRDHICQSLSIVRQNGLCLLLAGRLELLFLLL